MGATDSRVCDVCEKWAGAEDGFHPIGDEGPQKDRDILGAAPYEDPKATVEGGSAERKARVMKTASGWQWEREEGVGTRGFRLAAGVGWGKVRDEGGGRQG